MKKTLLLMLSACFLFAAAGCSPETDYSSEMNRLNAQIEQLQGELDALKGENSNTNALKEQIRQLQEQIADLQQQNAALEESSSQNTDKITDLENETTALKKELDAATARLTALEAAVKTEPVVCNFGDTYTLSNNGIDLFSIKFLDFVGNYITPEGQKGYRTLTCTITNHSMPSTSVSSYISALAVSDSSEFKHVDKSDEIIERGKSLSILVFSFG